ncbi:MAG: GNAT family N-acetyltransferase [Anaerolineales bacterium]|nr:GNAT family N-acetyltransferase [Anaerolineales bacterium]
MKSYTPDGEADIERLRAFVRRLPEPAATPDLDEAIQLASVQAATRWWEMEGEIVALAFVDDFNNLRFEIRPDLREGPVPDAVFAWGLACVLARNNQSGERATLDASFQSDNKWQIKLLEEYGFERSDLRTLNYARRLDGPLPQARLPDGFLIQSVSGEEEADALAALHRAAFGTPYMTAERRLAIMRAPGYEPALDLLAVAPDGALAAFCICGVNITGSPKTGYTDPLGTHPKFQRRGLAKALISTGLGLLKARGVEQATLGTSNKNLPMQRLAEAAGFAIESEKLWFSLDLPG